MKFDICRETNLGDGAVVDLDKVAGGRVYLQALVESESRLNSLGSCREDIVSIVFSLFDS